ncbi:hypothetical protein [Ilumatobacter sp.]|uniref:hypothetical protein n=1 Tax=Ilumatobacter sp. TaxID=1967498 RepID=UPI003B522890
MPSPVVLTVVAGSPNDGVRRFGALTAAARDATGAPSPLLVLDESSPGGPAGRVVGCDLVHLHLNDRLFDEDPVRWLEVVEAARAHGRPVAMTLHDVPGDEEGVQRCARRRVAQRRLAELADVVVVSSEHERSRAALAGIDAHVVPHPVFAAASVGAPRPARTPRTIVVAGFVHPGKGVAELLDSLDDVTGSVLAGWSLRLVGGVTDAHRDHLDDLRQRALRAGLGFEFTGAVSTRRWDAELRRGAIPVAPHSYCSASGSILSWCGLGRRPLVSDHGFAREIASERPGAVEIVGGDGWRRALERCVIGRDPRSFDPSGWRTPAASVAALDRIVTGVLASSSVA